MILLLLLPLSFLSCENTSNKVIDFFSDLGVRINIVSSNPCLSEQLDAIYQDALNPENTLKIIELVKKKELKEIDLITEFNFPVQCDQAIIGEDYSEINMICDPTTYKGSKTTLEETKVNLENRSLTLRVDSQEYLKNYIVYENFSNHNEEELKNFITEITRSVGDKFYISFDDIANYNNIGETFSIKNKSTESIKHDCGEKISLAEILKNIKS